MLRFRYDAFQGLFDEIFRCRVGLGKNVCVFRNTASVENRVNLNEPSRFCKIALGAKRKRNGKIVSAGTSSMRTSLEKSEQTFTYKDGYLCKVL